MLQLADSQFMLLHTGTCSIEPIPPQSTVVSGGSRPSSATPLTWSYAWQGGSDIIQSKSSDLGTILPVCSTAFQSLLSEYGAQHSSGGCLTISSTPASYALLSSGAIAGDLSHIVLLTETSPNARLSGQSALTGSSSSATGTGQLSILPAPGVKTGNIESSPTPRQPIVLPTCTSTFTPLAQITLPPSCITINPTGTTASNQGALFGGLLFALSKSIHGVDLTVPTVKAEILRNVENTMLKAENLFGDLGGTDSTGSCNGGSNVRRLTNPFTSLANLAGDILNIIGCASEVLKSLKDSLNLETPDPSLIGDLLGDLGTLAGEADPADNPDNKSLQRSSLLLTAPSSSSSMASFSSSSTATSTPSTLSSSFATGCTGCCVTDVPSLPSPPGVIATPTDDGMLGERAIPERFKLMKRGLPKTLRTISNCILSTPWNRPVTAPAYPGGEKFLASDKAHRLGSLATISRYYRSTNVGIPACTPTLTQINAAQWDFQRSGKVPENDLMSIDHAYENTFLTTFMESVIDMTDGVTCKNANTHFFSTGAINQNRLAPIFNALPSYKNLDFIAMSKWLNGNAKGSVLGPNYQRVIGSSMEDRERVTSSDEWADAITKIKGKMSYAQILVEAALIINADDTIRRMQRTNNRIYVAFRRLDTYLDKIRIFNKQTSAGQIITGVTWTITWLSETGLRHERYHCYWTE
ncbi:hypothetical protein N7G274_010173 [Stereocaulon virgatum]|uniref:Uncharacterized protein n=1 Tax=Stereocaulon virgatum TaxID=373712 RepID=A0ABR3ZVW0_9LECA